MKDDGRNLRKFRCDRCRNPCVTTPFFPPVADIVAVSNHYSHERIIDAITDNPSELACDVINFLIRKARAHRDHSVLTRLHCLVSNAVMLNDLLCRVASLQTEPVPELDEVTDGNGDLCVCRGEPEEVAVRSAQMEPFSSVPGIKLSVPRAFSVRRQSY